MKKLQDLTMSELLAGIRRLEEELDMYQAQWDDYHWPTAWALREYREELRRRTEPPEEIILNRMLNGEEV